MAAKPKAIITDDIFGNLNDQENIAPEQNENPTRKRATLNLTVDEKFKWEVKEWSTRHRMSVVDVMKEGFELIKNKHGK
jgi:hypothetical protein